MFIEPALIKLQAPEGAQHPSPINRLGILFCIAFYKHYVPPGLASRLDAQAFDSGLCGARAGTTDKTVADADHSFNAIAAFAKLLSQASDMHVERAGIAVVAVSPNIIQKVLASDDPICAFCQH